VEKPASTKVLAQSSAFFAQLAPPDRAFTEVALNAVTEPAEETFAGEYLAEIAKKRGIRLDSRAIQEAPDYLKGLLSWCDQVKKGRPTPCLDTSAFSPQVDQSQGIAALVAVGVLAGAVMIASAIELASSSTPPHYPRQDRPGSLRGGPGGRGRPGHRLPECDIGVSAVIRACAVVSG
jgi:hypothetical protein